MSHPFVPGTRIRRKGARRRGTVIPFPDPRPGDLWPKDIFADSMSQVRWDDGQNAREFINQLVLLSPIEALAEAAE